MSLPIQESYSQIYSASVTMVSIIGFKNERFNACECIYMTLNLQCRILVNVLNLFILNDEWFYLTEQCETNGGVVGGDDKRGRCAGAY